MFRPTGKYSLSGMFLFDKPSAVTSHGVVKLFREKLGFQRIGHSGTLDPMATGLLIMLCGVATKYQSLFQGMPKVYEGEITFGVETDTWDKEGRIISSAEPRLTAGAIKRVVEFMSGKVLQRVPPFSAVKFRGKRLYKLARQNKAVPSIMREVNIKWLRYSYAKPKLKFAVECSGGTYIRSLAFEMGKTLGVGAHLSSLRRLSIGGWRISDAFGMDFLNSADRKNVLARLIKVSEMPEI